MHDLAAAFDTEDGPADCFGNLLSVALDPGLGNGSHGEAIAVYEYGPVEDRLLAEGEVTHNGREPPVGVAQEQDIGCATYEARQFACLDIVAIWQRSAEYTQLHLATDLATQEHLDPVQCDDGAGAFVYPSGEDRGLTAGAEGCSSQAASLAAAVFQFQGRSSSSFWML